MSTAKNKVIKLSEFVDVGEVISRMTLAIGGKDVADLATFLGVSVQAVYGYRKGARDVGWEMIFKVISETGKSLDWIIYGEEKGAISEKVNRVITDPTGGKIARTAESENGEEKLHPTVKEELLKMTLEVLDSETVYRPALVSNIRAFHFGIKGVAEMSDMKSEVQAMRQDIARLEALILNITPGQDEKNGPATIIEFDLWKVNRQKAAKCL